MIRLTGRWWRCVFAMALCVLAPSVGSEVGQAARPQRTSRRVWTVQRPSGPVGDTQTFARAIPARIGSRDPRAVNS